MDRRFAIAIVLSFLVLMLSQVLFAPDPPEVPVQEPAGEGKAVHRDPSPDPALEERGDPYQIDQGADFKPAAPLPVLEESQTEETFSIERDLFNAQFSNRGGNLQSWSLTRYQKLDGEPVQIVRQPGELGLTLESNRGLITLDDALFTTRLGGVSGGDQQIIFEVRTEDGLVVTKTYTLPSEGYLIGLRVDIRGATDVSNYRLTWKGGIPEAEKDRKQYQGSAGSMIMLGKSVDTIKPKSFKNETQKVVSGNVRWAAVRNKYFMATLIPPPETSSIVVVTGDNEEKITGVEVVMPLLRGEGAHEFKLFLGPMEYGRLKALGYGLDQGVDLGYRIFRPVSKLLLVSMVWLYGIIPNYGIVILIISALTKVIFYPLTKSSLRSMKAMQTLQPAIKEIREKYKGDAKRMQQKTMALYKENKVNPVGGCLPILLQMPVFIALYAVLANSITMRQAYFGGWITDLSVPDTIAVVGGFAIHVLPVVMFATTVLQTRLTPATDPRQKMMGHMMPIVMLVIFYSFPAGLNLYWTVNNALTVAQQWSIHRGVEREAKSKEAEA